MLVITMGSDAQSIDLDALRAGVADACARVPEVKTAYLFGSQLHGTSHAASDLDVAVDFGAQLAAQQRGEAKLRLIAALTDRLGTLGERTDVVDLRHVGSGVAFRAIRDGRRVKDLDRRERVRLEAQIARAYDEDAPRRALFLRAAIRAAQRMGKSTAHG